MIAFHNGENKAQEPLNQEYFQMHTFREMFIEDYIGFMKKVPDILEADILTSFLAKGP
jgi:hypothetical protein